MTMPPATPRLYIGNKNYSSWSLRPWLVLRWGRIPFEEVEVRLDQPGYGVGGIAQIRAVSPTGQVPALVVDGYSIWDSLAISEWAAERSVTGSLWPNDGAARAMARAVTCEMHSGFAPLRRDLPMNITRRCQPPPESWPAETTRSIARIEELWVQMRARYGAAGSFLFGSRSIADAFFTPVATRMRTYGVTLAAEAANYRDTLLANDDFREWEMQCKPNSWDKAGYSIIDRVYPGA
jgi:glutathione S-transferase